MECLIGFAQIVPTSHLILDSRNHLLGKSKLKQTISHLHVRERDSAFRHQIQLVRIRSDLVDGLCGFQATTISGESDIDLHKIGRIIVGNILLISRVFRYGIPMGLQIILSLISELKSLSLIREFFASIGNLGCAFSCFCRDTLIGFHCSSICIDQIIDVVSDIIQNELERSLINSLNNLLHRYVLISFKVQCVRNCCSIVARLIGNLHRADRCGIGSGSQENVVVLFFVASHLFFDIQTDMNIDAVGNRGHKSRFFLFTG